MTITNGQLVLYFGALIILFLTPGPVWIALIARTVSGGTKSAISLALGVSLGDFLWPIAVFFGLGFLVSLYSEILILFRYLAAIILTIMGIQTILNSRKKLYLNSQLTKSGFFAGFSAGFIAVTANPKASLFYLTLLPSFFNFDRINFFDIMIISIVSFSVPMIGNILMILFLSKVRSFLSSPNSVRITNVVSGVLLIGVGVIIGLT
ncbi:MAG: LysE family translocator [Pseudomonadota bacterium]|nr:LysE family translocator [Pseudomonadota bacterium]